MSWLARLFQRRAPRDALLNEGLALAMDWGDDWLAPINARLQDRHRYLRAGELAILNEECQAAMRRGHQIAHTRLRDGGPDVEPDDFARHVREHHDWVDRDNMVRLRNQSIYYAAKTGVFQKD